MSATTAHDFLAIVGSAQNLVATVDKLKGENEGLKRENTALKQENEALREDKEDLRIWKLTLKNHLGSLEAESAALGRDKEDLRRLENLALHQSYESIRSQIRRLRKAVATRQERILSRLGKEAVEETLWETFAEDCEARKALSTHGEVEQNTPTDA